MTFAELRELDDQYQKAETLKVLRESQFESARVAFTTAERALTDAVNDWREAEGLYFDGIRRNQEWIENGMKTEKGGAE